MRKHSRFGSVAVVALFVGVLQGASPLPSMAAEPAAVPVARGLGTQVSPGVWYKKIVQKKPSRTVHLLTVDPASPATLDTTVAGNAFPSWNLPSKMIKEEGGIAGINGDFGLSPGRPAHPAMVDGEFIQTSVIGGKGRVFAMRADESEAFIDQPNPRIILRNETAGTRLRIDEWNQGAPQAAHISAVSPRGGTVEKPPTDSCSARLLPDGPARWSTGDETVVRPYHVDASRCGATAMTLDGGVVVSAREDAVSAPEVSALQVGDQVELDWSMGWDNVADAIGGSAVLLKDGVIAVQACDEYLCLRHPRTSVGVLEDGKVIMVVIDGRSLRSGGATLTGLAKLMRSLGAVDALNLDGGGSSVMVVNGKVVSTPSDGHERAVTSTLFVRASADPDENL